MSKTTKYFFKRLASIATFPDDLYIIIKNFKLDEHHHKYWFAEDEIQAKRLGEAKHFTKVSIIGCGYEHAYYTNWFNVSDTDEAVLRSSQFEWPWSIWGTTTFRLLDIPNGGPLQAFFEHAFSKMLEASEHGMNVFIDKELFIEKDTAFQHRMNIDLMLEP